MILSLLFALQSGTSPVTPIEPDIVVLANKLRRIDVDMKMEKRGGIVILRSCRVTRPSGEGELDAIPCGVAQQCVTEGVVSKRQLVACVEGKSNREIDAIVAARREAAIKR
ncbi:hypothetical protein [Sphingomonas sp. PAMC 26621]|uniref:hypothetical protein n=1 Tax=Sphingomonas sp. PAMC 26621 TaxID=1112213 RepID=UPI000289CF1A|nr:hypothetical protein [Sphingomonas sp. PAMC 26621]